MDADSCGVLCFLWGLVMNSRKRFLVWVLSAVLVVGGVGYTYREAKAFLAGVAVLAMPEVLVAGATAAKYVLTAMAGLLGAAGIYAVVSDLSGNESRIPVAADTSTVVPQPDLPEAAVEAAPIPQTSWIDDSKWLFTFIQGSGNVMFSTEAECVAFFNANKNLKPNATEATACRKIPNANADAGIFCPRGYYVEGTQCIARDARAAVRDNKCDLQFVKNGAGSRYLYFDDLDCPMPGANIQLSKSVPGLRMEGKKAIVYGQTADGVPSVTEVLVQSDGAQIVVRRYVQTTTTELTQSEATFGTTGGVVQGYTQANVSGSLSIPAVVPSVVTGAGTAADTPIVSSSSSTTGSGSSSITLPTDYARQGEATTAAQSIIQALDITGVDAVPRAWKDSLPPDYEGPDAPKGIIENLKDPELPWADLLPRFTPGAPIACHPIEITLFTPAKSGLSATGTQTLDMCPFFEIVRIFIGYLFAVMTVLYVWRTFTSSQSWNK